MKKTIRPEDGQDSLRPPGSFFDMGPSWYWMPDVFEHYFQSFGRKVSDFYDLKRLDPSYRVYFEDGPVDIPANLEAFKALLESYETGAGKKLDQFLQEAAYKYKVGMTDLVYKPSRSIFEFFDFRVAKGLVKLHLLKSFSKHVRSFFTHPKIIQILEFPVLFLGAKPENIPALYSLMNYADIGLGTWYPMGGMRKIVEGMEQVARDLGVNIKTGEAVKKIEVKSHAANQVITEKAIYRSDVVVGAADYHHVEQHLLDEANRSYSPKYWEKRVMAPSSLLFYVGVNRKVNNLQHHNLFFDTSFEEHAKEIYD